ncbi:hypothetical protein JW926_18640 [Candidatus Sumerlaeota bacterium]|nr:hypothetical protein [Candidatus Sumerlaeota bacterium]
MNKREKILGAASLLLVLGLIFYQFGFSEIYDKISFDSSGLGNLKDTYEKYQGYMKKERQIRTKYYEIVGRETNPGEKKGIDPQKEFSEFVSELCRRLDFAYPRIDPPSLVPIANVDDYAFVTLNIHTNGDTKRISKLLKGFDREAVLIRELTLRSKLDSPELDLTITVARMIPVEAPKQDKGKTSSKESSGKFVTNARGATSAQKSATSENEDE